MLESLPDIANALWLDTTTGFHLNRYQIQEMQNTGIKLGELIGSDARVVLCIQRVY